MLAVAWIHALCCVRSTYHHPVNAWPKDRARERTKDDKMKKGEGDKVIQESGEVMEQPIWVKISA